jgi:hypothetical protein
MELLLTVLTLLAAIYAVIPRERQLDLRLRVRTLDWAVIILASTAVLYLEFFDFCEAHGWIFSSRPWPDGITPQNTIYLVMVVAVIFVGLRIRFAHLTTGNIRKFRELVEELYWSQSFGELFAMLQTHRKELFRIYDSDYFLARLQRQMQPLSSFEEFLLEARPNDTKPKGMRVSKRVLALLRPFNWILSGVLPEYSQAQETARELVRAIFLSPRFVEALARTRPYLGLEMIRTAKPSFERYDFAELYLKALLSDPQSVFYTEIRNNQNIIKGSRYVIPESNPLIHFFLADVHVAENMKVYKPIGDFIESHLDDLARDHENDPYNRAMGDFDEAEVWHSPVFAGTRFFDVMVKEALFQGIEWHMWLYYMPPIVERIVRNYRLCDPLPDQEAEFPIRYSYLLHQIFTCMADWVMAVEEVPPDQPNVVLGPVGPELDNGNIPKSSLIALSQSTQCILESPHIGRRLKRTLACKTFNIYFDLRRSGRYSGYAETLLSLITQIRGYQPVNDVRRRDALMRIFQEEKSEYRITRPEQHVNDLEFALGKTS